MSITGVTARCAADCGHCCDPVSLSWHPGRLRGWTSANIAALVADNDPATEEGWAAWQARGFEDREDTLEQTVPGSRRQLNADFLTAHWTVIAGSDDPNEPGHRLVRCDVYDPVTRRCGAYEGRPPICRDFPHYGQPLTRDTPLNPVCTFNAEVRTMLPIVAVR